MATADVSSASGFPAPHREAREPSEVGRRIADRYQIEGQGREGASTVTVLARHLALDERVQIQVLRAEQRFDAPLSAQYLRSIKELARIKTDHVERVLDVGIALYLGPFLVLEELEGKTLAELLRAGGPLPVPRAVDYVLQACKGLAVAHAAGIVHGQLHPGRLLLARRGEFETLKVIDFPTMAVAAAERGPAYLAPELASGGSADRRADVWSLGAVLYELVTGRSAFPPAAASAAIANDALAYDDPALTPALRSILSRCLQPEPEQRFADVEALAAELMPLTTMNEVFRGSLTGSFSRQMMMAAAAQARAAASSAAQARSQPSGWRARLLAVPASLQRWTERWRVLDRRWQERKPAGAPALPLVLGGAALLLLGVGSAALGDLTLRPPPPAPEVAPEVAVAALSPAPEAPASPEPSVLLNDAPLEVVPGIAGQPAAGLLAGSVPPLLERPVAAEEPSRAALRRSARAAASRATARGTAGRATASRAVAKKRANRDSSVPKRRERRARPAPRAE